MWNVSESLGVGDRDCMEYRHSSIILATGLLLSVPWPRTYCAWGALFTRR